MEQKGQEPWEHEIGDAEQDGGGDGHHDDHGGVIDGLLSRRPIDVIHLGARVFDVSYEAVHVRWSLLKNP